MRGRAQKAAECGLNAEAIPLDADSGAWWGSLLICGLPGTNPVSASELAIWHQSSRVTSGKRLYRDVCWITISSIEIGTHYEGSAG